jgi:integrase
MRKRLTDALVKNAPLATGKTKTRIWDEPDGRKLFVSGFGVQISRGAKSFVLRYRRKLDGVERLHTIGPFPVYSTDAARNEALELRRRIKDGGDPQQELRLDRSAPDMNALCDKFITEHLPSKAPGTQREYRSQIEGDIRPALGRKRVEAVDHDDVVKLHRKITERAPHRANRVAALLHKMFELAKRWRMRTGDNPARGIEHNVESKRKRYLSQAELAALTDALAQHPDQNTADIFRVLLLTGCRAGEAMRCKWTDLDLTDRRVWIKPAHTVKQKREHETPLSDAALALFTARRKAASEDAEYVFPGHTVAGHRSQLRRAWDAVCQRAGIARKGQLSVRIHDIRHTHASIMISSGFSLATVGAALGHTQPNTTARYAHLFDDVQREAANKVGSVLSGLTVKPSKRKRKPRLRVVR